MELLSLRELKSLAPANPGEYRTHVQVERSLSKQARSGNPYYEMHFVDAGTSLKLRAWDDTAAFAQSAGYKGGEFVEISGTWSENGSFGLDARDWTLRPLNEDEIGKMLGGSPELAAKQATDYAAIEDFINRIADPRLKSVCDQFMDMFGERFRRTAAARFNHHARRGGLVEHVAQMMRAAATLCDAYPQLNRDLLIAGVLFHDCGKLWENCYPETGFSMAFSDHGEMLGHINIGIEIVNKLWRQASDSEDAADWGPLDPPSDQVRLHLLHLVASHHGQYEFGAPVLPKTPEAIVLHHIDNIDAKLEMFFEGYKSSPQLAPNIFDRVRPLPNNLVRPLEHFTAASPPHENANDIEPQPEPSANPD